MQSISTDGHSEDFMTEMSKHDKISGSEMRSENISPPECVFL